MHGPVNCNLQQIQRPGSATHVNTVRSGNPRLNTPSAKHFAWLLLLFWSISMRTQAYLGTFYQAFLVVCAVYDRRGRVVWGKEIFLVLWGMYDDLPGPFSRDMGDSSDIV